MDAVIGIPEANPQLYRAATTTGVLWNASANGRLRLTDRDRLDLLQRLTTNDVNRLTAGMGTRTVLINHHARIIDLLTVYALPEHVLLVTGPGQGGAISGHLGRNIFFKDRLKVEEITDQTVQYDLYGPSWGERLQELTGMHPAKWPLHHMQAVRINKADGWLARTLPLGGGGWSLFAERGAWQRMESAFAETPRLDDGTFHVLRIEAGYPYRDHELSLEYIPLETRLLDAISFAKGCYVGQEIIARMESRHRLAKQLMRLIPEGEVVAPAKLEADGKAAGEITSLARTLDGRLVGLGYVRNEWAHAGAALQVGAVRVAVEALPEAAV
ncbi:MAG: glycine cleavage T C-terminal barrel domain-containing protein [Herpetosiphon sp.]